MQFLARYRKPLQTFAYILHSCEGFAPRCEGFALRRANTGWKLACFGNWGEGERFSKHTRADTGGTLARFGNWGDVFLNMRGLILPLCERRIQFLSDAIWCFNGSNQPSRWSGRCTLIFYHDTGKQFWSGCISLHQASRI